MSHMESIYSHEERCNILSYSGPNPVARWRRFMHGFALWAGVDI
jgi:hypothetical protein